MAPAGYTRDPNDPYESYIYWLDESAVHRLYGPGIWIAWITVLLASWIPIIRNRHSSMFALVGAMLYPNWAAFDLLHHNPDNYGFRYDSVTGKRIFMSLFEPASFPVISVGFLNALVQALVCLHQQRSAAKVSRPAVYRIWILRLSLLLPSLALMSYMPHMVREIDPLLPHRPFLGSRRWRYYLLWSIDYVPSFLLWSYSAPLHARFHGSYQLFAYASFGISYAAACALCSWVVGMYFLYTGTHWFPQKCFFKPCAPQKLDEPEQVFALCFAVAYVLYEVYQYYVRLTKKGKKKGMNLDTSDLPVYQKG